jgi:chemotaxis protein methyltransferase CheR
VVDTEGLEVRLLLEAISERYHYDFRGYSSASMRRRVAEAQRRLQCPTVSKLQDRILHDPTVLPELLGCLTVPVSDFFRDPEYFRALREQVVPHLRTYPSLKVWVAGCCTGEEFYSLKILFREEGLESRTLFYATDINPEALRRAEAGVYALDRMPLFTQNHRLSGATRSLSEYYTAAYGGVAFDRTLRERTVFADHSLATDSVFAEAHLISCRNVLIYFDRDLQDRAIGLFRESLVRKGFLGLGSKERLLLSEHRGAFEEFVVEQRIYQKVGE